MVSQSIERVLRGLDADVRGISRGRHWAVSNPGTMSEACLLDVCLPGLAPAHAAAEPSDSNRNATQV